MYLQRFTLTTHKKIDLIDITDTIAEAVTSSQVCSGICLVISLHTTAAIVVNENESGFVKDVCKTLPHLGCIEDSEHDKRHTVGNENAHAHLLAMLSGHDATIPIAEGKLVLGTWQRIFFLELDGPRPRDPDGNENYPVREYTISILSG